MATDEVVEVVRARRFELVDDANRVRAVIGSARHADGEATGLEIFDATGSARAWLLDDDRLGVVVALTIGGNQALIAAAHEPGANATVSRASLTLSNLVGAPVLSWRVRHDGTAEMWREDAESDDDVD